VLFILAALSLLGWAGRAHAVVDTTSDVVPLSDGANTALRAHATGSRLQALQESASPSEDVPLTSGVLRSVQGLCLDLTKHALIWLCSSTAEAQLWEYHDATRQVKQSFSDQLGGKGSCLSTEVGESGEGAMIGGGVIAQPCNTSDARQEWHLFNTNGWLQNGLGLCLDVIDGRVQMNTCNPAAPEQQWQFSPADKPLGIPEIHCKTTDWSAYSTCSLPCGGGEQERTRAITMAPSKGGAGCGNLVDKRKCNTSPCAPDGISQSMDGCVVGPWSGYSQCTHKCDGGIQVRSRDVLIQAKGAGVACPDLHEERECNTAGCLHPPPANTTNKTLQGHEWHPSNGQGSTDVNTTGVAQQQTLAELAAAEKQIQDMVAEEAAQRLEMVNLTSENAVVTARLPQIEAEILELKQKNADMAYLMGKLNVANEQMSMKLENAGHVPSDRDDMKQRIATLEEEARELESDKAALAKQLGEAQLLASSTQTRLDEESSTLKTCEDQLATTEAQLTDTSTKASESEAALLQKTTDLTETSLASEKLQLEIKDALASAANATHVANSTHIALEKCAGERADASADLKNAQTLLHSTTVQFNECEGAKAAVQEALNRASASPDEAHTLLDECETQKQGVQFTLEETETSVTKLNTTVVNLTKTNQICEAAKAKLKEDLQTYMDGPPEEDSSDEANVPAGSQRL